MVTFNDADEFFETAAAGGTAFRFKDIDGIGPATANKIKSIRGVQNPEDIADYTAEDLAEEAGISESRARKAIKGGGGNPSFDERNKTTGSVSAGNLAEQMDAKKDRAATLVKERQTLFEQLVETGEEVPERRARRRDPESNPFFERDPEEVRQVGQAADIFSTATSDPVDPTADSPDLGFSEEDRERASQVRLAAQEVLEEKEGLDFDEATSETTASTKQPPEFERVKSVLSGGGTMTFGDFQVPRGEYEEAEEEFAQQSPEAKRVDKRRRAPITTNEDVYARAPGRYDFPGVDTPTEDPQFKRKDTDTVDKEDTTLEERKAGIFPATLGDRDVRVEADLPGGLGLGTGTRKAAKEKAESQLPFDIREAANEQDFATDAVAEITLLERDREDSFGDDRFVFDVSGETDLSKHNF